MLKISIQESVFGHRKVCAVGEISIVLDEWFDCLYMKCGKIESVSARAAQYLRELLFAATFALFTTV